LSSDGTLTYRITRGFHPSRLTWHRSRQNVWKYNVPIQLIEIYGDGSFAISAPAGTDAACPQNGTYFQVTAGQNSMTTDGVKAALAVALTAFLAGKTITFAADTATSQCYSTNITINP
jgi:hypothetical protein